MHNRYANTLDLYPEYKAIIVDKKTDPEVRFIASFLKKYTRQIDQTEYLITYHDLNERLKKFHYFLDRPNGNKIDVMKEEEEISLLFRKKIVPRRIGSISFPGWTRQVSREDIRLVRKITRLTPDKGVDSGAFFGNSSSLGSLIDEFQPLLLRLSDK